MQCSLKSRYCDIANQHVYWAIVTESSTFLYTGAESNLGDRVLGEVEEDSFIALPGKGRHTGLLPQENVSTPEDLMKGFYNRGSKAGSLTRLGCEQGLHFLNLLSDAHLLILTSFSGPFNLASGGFLAAPPLILASGGFLAAPPLISNCPNPPSGTQGRSQRWSLAQKKWGDKKGLCAWEPHRALSFTMFRVFSTIK